MNRTRIEAAGLLLILAAAAPLQAGPDAAAEDGPSMELLEFLGNWSTAEEDWFDPLRMLDGQTGETGETDEKPHDEND